jgi:hypothetical protein
MTRVISSTLAHQKMERGEVFGRIVLVPSGSRGLALLRLRDPDDRSLSVKTLHLGMVENSTVAPERFFCASER